MSINASRNAIRDKGVYISGITDYSQCPKYSFILSNSSAVITGSYEDNQLVQLEDIFSSTANQTFLYNGYGITLDEAHSNYDSGVLYLIGSHFYTDNQANIPAASGFYITQRGIMGPPNYEDSEWMTVL